MLNTALHSFPDHTGGLEALASMTNIYASLLKKMTKLPLPVTHIQISSINILL